MELSDLDRRHLIEFVEEVLIVIRNDDTSTTADLEDLAMTAGEILGLSVEYMKELE